MKNDNTNLDLIIILNGGFIPIKTCKKDYPTAEKILKEALSKSNTEDGFVNFFDSVFKVKSLIGWYVRESHITLAEQQIEIMKNLEKKMPDTNDGDDWKNG